MTGVQGAEFVLCLGDIGFGMIGARSALAGAGGVAAGVIVAAALASTIAASVTASVTAAITAAITAAVAARGQGSAGAEVEVGEETPGRSGKRRGKGNRNERLAGLAHRLRCEHRSTPCETSNRL